MAVCRQGSCEWKITDGRTCGTSTRPVHPSSIGKPEKHQQRSVKPNQVGIGELAEVIAHGSRLAAWAHALP
jgi:hypothetical protein